MILNLFKVKLGLNVLEVVESFFKSWRIIMCYFKFLNDKGLVEFRGVLKIGGYYLIRNI